MQWAYCVVDHTMSYDTNHSDLNFAVASSTAHAKVWAGMGIQTVPGILGRDGRRGICLVCIQALGGHGVTFEPSCGSL